MPKIHTTILAALVFAVSVSAHAQSQMARVDVVMSAFMPLTIALGSCQEYVAPSVVDEHVAWFEAVLKERGVEAKRVPYATHDLREVMDRGNFDTRLDLVRLAHSGGRDRAINYCVDYINDSIERVKAGLKEMQP